MQLAPECCHGEGFIFGCFLLFNAHIFEGSSHHAAMPSPRTPRQDIHKTTDVTIGRGGPRSAGTCIYRQSCSEELHYSEELWLCAGRESSGGGEVCRWQHNVFSAETFRCFDERLICGGNTYRISSLRSLYIYRDSQSKRVENCFPGERERERGGKVLHTYIPIPA